MKRRIAIFAALVLALTVAVPPGAVPADQRFPLSGLWSWLRQAPAWSAEVLGVPGQSWAGGAAGRGHDATVEQTRANGGAGTAPLRGPGAVDPEPPRRAAPSQWTSPRLKGESGFDAATSRRLPERATARSDVFENADGSLTQRLYSTPK
ncbi:MAG TPA: hypothetical protein VF163_14275, partial [Micromonosporaceae bacterium]